MADKERDREKQRQKIELEMARLNATAAAIKSTENAIRLRMTDKVSNIIYLLMLIIMIK